MTYIHVYMCIHIYTYIYIYAADHPVPCGCPGQAHWREAQHGGPTLTNKWHRMPMHRGNRPSSLLTSLGKWSPRLSGDFVGFQFSPVILRASRQRPSAGGLSRGLAVTSVNISTRALRDVRESSSAARRCRVRRRGKRLAGLTDGPKPARARYWRAGRPIRAPGEQPRSRPDGAGALNLSRRATGILVLFVPFWAPNTAAILKRNI